MNKTIAAIIITAILSGCQTADETLTTSSTPITVTGATASAIAGDMASRLAEQVGPAALRSSRWTRTPRNTRCSRGRAEGMGIYGHRRR